MQLENAPWLEDRKASSRADKAPKSSLPEAASFNPSSRLRVHGLRRGDFLACFVLVVLALACFARLVAEPGGLLVDGEQASLDNTLAGDQRVLGNDLTFLFLPHYLNVTTHLSRFGRIPYWDSSGFAGRPLVGNPQGGLFYPPVWLAWLARSPSALGWLTVAHLLWAGVGTYVLARSLRMGRFASTVAAGCFQASPILLAHTFEGHYPHVWASCWYPWAFWAFFEHKAGRRRGAIVLPITLALTFLAGHPQEWYYLLLALSAWTLVDAARNFWAGQTRSALASLIKWTGLVCLSLGAVAIEFLPDLAAQRWTPRNGQLASWQVNTYNPRLANLLQLLSPSALGMPSDYFGQTNYWESLVSVGLVPLILGVIAVAKSTERSLVRRWLALTLTAMIFAGGKRLGLFTVLYVTLPGMSFFRVPSRSLLLAALGAAMLAGLGIEALLKLAESIEDWTRMNLRFRQAAGFLLAGLLAGATFCWLGDPVQPTRPKPPPTTWRVRVKSHDGNRVWTLPRSEDRLGEDEEEQPPRGRFAASRIAHHAVFWLALGGSAAALAYGAFVIANRRAAVWAFGLCALVELALNGHALLRVAPTSRFLDADPVSVAIAGASPSAPQPFRIRAVDQLYDDLHAKVNGFEKININDWFQVHHAAELYKELYALFDRHAPGALGEQMGEIRNQAHREIRQGILDRLGIAFLISDHVEPSTPWQLIQSGTWQDRPFVVYRNRDALPRAYVVPRVHVASGEVTGLLALFRQVDPRQAVIMERDPLQATARRQPYTPAAMVPRNEPDRVVIRTSTEAPGLLVIADTWMPGWTATLNGKPASILRGNHAQRVIPLPEPGSHEVIMTYRPPNLTLGATITGVSLLTWLVMSTQALLIRRLFGEKAALRISPMPAALGDANMPTQPRRWLTSPGPEPAFSNDARICPARPWYWPAIARLCTIGSERRFPRRARRAARRLQLFVSGCPAAVCGRFADRFRNPLKSVDWPGRAWHYWRTTRRS